MNKLLLILSFCIVSCWTNAQSFTDKALTQAVSQLNSSKTVNDYDDLFTKFSKAKTSEKLQADYYAAVSLYLKNELLLKSGSSQNTGDDNAMARKIAIGVWTAKRDNAEFNILIGLLYFQKMQIDQSQNADKDLNTISEMITKAGNSSSSNPRLAILKAKMKEKAGDKAGADVLFQQAISEFGNQNSSDGTPSWGKQLLQSNK
ncbi:hypothetical protein [Chryseobacterium sp. JK1]|uniref:hypothetical protein n=1 Tax=Chryseobacterium sp. JK1 TaxID=874294 RepID=UPI003D69A431